MVAVKERKFKFLRQTLFAAKLFRHRRRNTWVENGRLAHTNRTRFCSLYSHNNLEDYLTIEHFGCFGVHSIKNLFPEFNLSASENWKFASRCRIVSGVCWHSRLPNGKRVVKSDICQFGPIRLVLRSSRARHAVMLEMKYVSWFYR